MTLLTAVVIGATLFLAYSNGANDNFKGVATLLGSRVVNYRTALAWATVTTFLGSLSAAFLASELITVFTGSGLVPDQLIAAPEFMAAVVLGAGLTVFTATLLGLPISTTHSLLGALLGSALAGHSGGINLATLNGNFLYPLLASPLIAMALVGFLHPLVLQLARLRPRAGRGIMPHLSGAMAAVGASLPRASAGSEVQPSPAGSRGGDPSPPSGGTRRFAAHDVLHLMSAGAVSFARGLNDTPKIVAILLGAQALNLQPSVLLVALLMAAGGILQARKIARTMSFRITALNRTEGAFVNLVTSTLVIFASRWGVPVSTTHVSCGSLFGLGLVKGSLNWGVLGGIFSAWVSTVPIGLALSYGAYTVLVVLR